MKSDREGGRSGFVWWGCDGGLCCAGGEEFIKDISDFRGTGHAFMAVLKM